jgi:hypothetical protein
MKSGRVSPVGRLAGVLFVDTAASCGACARTGSRSRSSARRSRWAASSRSRLERSTSSAWRVTAAPTEALRRSRWAEKSDNARSTRCATAPFLPHRTAVTARSVPAMQTGSAVREPPASTRRAGACHGHVGAASAGNRRPGRGGPDERPDRRASRPSPDAGRRRDPGSYGEATSGESARPGRLAPETAAPRVGRRRTRPPNRRHEAPLVIAAARRSARSCAPADPVWCCSIV